MDEKLETLIDGLNVDLANVYGAAIQYSDSASVVPGRPVSTKNFL